MLMKMLLMIPLESIAELCKDVLNHDIGSDASSLIDEDGLEKSNNDDADNNDEESVELSKDLLHQSKTCRKQQQMDTGRKDTNTNTQTKFK